MMQYQGEIDFLCEVYKRMHVGVKIIEEEKLGEQLFEEQRKLLFYASRDVGEHAKLYNSINGETLYHQRDTFGLCYSYLLLTTEEERRVLFIGPYFSTAQTAKNILEMAERNGILPKYQQKLEEYYAVIPIISRSGPLMQMLSTLCEKIWQSVSFSVVDIDDEHRLPASPINNSLNEENFDGVLADMKIKERRYEFENEMIEAVTHGQLHKESALLSVFTEEMFERRITDLLRNAKNYSVIMNTLLRKAAERGGVHPIYIDRVSSYFASKIENMPTLGEIGPLMREMFKTYCRLVNKHTMKGYGPLVKKTVILIDSDLSAPITPSGLAKAQNVSLGHLCTVFKEETGKTITEFIRERRITHAKHLLRTTSLQIQTVALHCGIVDLQYFSKVFKRMTGKTPREYRDEKMRVQSSRDGEPV